MNGPAKGPDQKVKKNNGCLQKFVAMFKKNGVAPKDGLKVIKVYGRLLNKDTELSGNSSRRSRQARPLPRAAGSGAC